MELEDVNIDESEDMLKIRLAEDVLVSVETRERFCDLSVCLQKLFNY
jgi:hypothetical protein